MQRNYKDEFFNFLLSKKRIVVILIVYLSISALGNFIDSVNKIWNGIEYITIRLENKKLSDNDLIIQSRKLAKEMSLYLTERDINQPKVDYNNWDQSVRDSEAYSAATIGHYYTDFESKVSLYRAEFLKRGLISKTVDDFYGHPTNPIVIQLVANGLNELAAQQQSK